MQERGATDTHTQSLTQTNSATNTHTQTHTHTDSHINTQTHSHKHTGVQGKGTIKEGDRKAIHVQAQFELLLLGT